MCAPSRVNEGRALLARTSNSSVRAKGAPEHERLWLESAPETAKWDSRDANCWRALDMDDMCRYMLRGRVEDADGELSHGD